MASLLAKQITRKFALRSVLTSSRPLTTSPGTAASGEETRTGGGISFRKPREHPQHPGYVPSKMLGYGSTSENTSLKRFVSRNNWTKFKEEALKKKLAAEALLGLHQARTPSELHDRYTD